MKHIDIIYTRHNRGGKPPRISPSVITYYDLTLLLSGNLHYTVDGCDILLESGDAILIPAGSLRARAEGAQGADYISFNFTTEGEIPLPLWIKRAVRSEITLLVAAYDKMEKHTYTANKSTLAYLCGCILSVLSDISATAEYNPLTK